MSQCTASFLGAIAYAIFCLGVVLVAESVQNWRLRRTSTRSKT